MLAYLAILITGFVLGLLGGGGSILTVPILVYLFKLDAVTATGYSLFVVGSAACIGAFRNYKKDNLNFMLQKLTEVGVYEFIFYKPDLVDQSIAKKDSEKIINKCNEVIINACKQCGSNFIPAIYYFSNLELAVNSVKGIGIESYAFDLDAKEHFNLAEIKTGEDVCMITGPESGFSKEEIEILSKKDTKIRLLKNNVLRAETAPIVISSLLQNHFGNI